MEHPGGGAKMRGGQSHILNTTFTFCSFVSWGSNTAVVLPLSAMAMAVDFRSSRKSAVHHDFFALEYDL